MDIENMTNEQKKDVLTAMRNIAKEITARLPDGPDKDWGRLLIYARDLTKLIEAIEQKGICNLSDTEYVHNAAEYLSLVYQGAASIALARGIISADDVETV